LNQQQLQIARAALWRQTTASPLLTFDDAALWLDEIGLCLFLPRHTQLPAPAPSFVEACLGATSVTPPPAAIALATELLTRLVAERRIIPLNLLGALSDQPDFLVSTEILPWVAAVRGDRQWKSAPGGRTSPIVLRTWEALDREGELTAVQIRELLGRELTEAAVLRALNELWTNLRAVPISATGESGQPTRWTLLKNRFPAQLATAANTAQTTALSVLLSTYLRSAVAVTAEEAEIFLSPLTARSRIREVIHGMMATRQVGTTPVATHTLLFIEGSLPESAPEPEAEKQHAPPATPSPALRAPFRKSLPGRQPFRKEPFRKGPRPAELGIPNPSARPPQDRRPPWQKKPAAPHRPAPSTGGRSREAPPPREARPFSAARPQSRPGRGPASRPESRPGSHPHSDRSHAKPWQRRQAAPFRKPAFPNQKFRKQEGAAPPAPPPESGQARESRPPGESGLTRQQRWPDKKFGQPQSRQNRPWQKGRPFRDQRPPRSDRPGSPDRVADNDRPPSSHRSGESRPFRPQSAPPAGSFRPRPDAKFGNKPGGKFGAKPGRKFSPKPGAKFGPKPSAKFGPKPSGKFNPRAGARSRFAPPRSPRPETPAEGRTERPARSFRPAPSSSGKRNRASSRGPRPPSRGPRPSRPDKLINKFRKPSTGEPKPRKTRNQDQDSE